MNWFLSADATATLIAGLGGAAVGGLIAALVQSRASRRETHDRRREAAVKLLLTAVAIRDRARIFQALLVESRKILDPGTFKKTMGRDPEEWEPYGPFVDREMTERATPADLMPLLDAEAFVLLARYTRLIDQDRYLELFIREYSSTRREYQKCLGVTNISISGKVMLNKEEWEEIKPKWEKLAVIRYAMSDMTNQIIKQNPATLIEATEVAVAISKRMAAHFSDPKSPSPDLKTRGAGVERKPWWVR